MTDLDIKKIYGKNTDKIQNSENRAVYNTVQKSGTGTIYYYDVFDGIHLFLMDFFVESIDYSGMDTNFSHDIICINHCEKGRFEAEFKNGQFVYLGEKAISLNLPENSPINHTFPLGRFLGIMLVIEIEKAKNSLQKFSEIYGEIPIDFVHMKENLLAGNKFTVYRNNRILSAIFESLYEKLSDNQTFFLKNKMLELLFLLSSDNVKTADPCRYFTKQQVQKVKSINKLITKNLATRYKLKELSQMFDISLTSLKECFSEVYGLPISVYIREYRISIAEKFLRETALSVADISDRIGYENQSKFSEMFKKVTDMTPIEYRNKKVDSKE